jgi:hypothetical protein
MRDWVRNKMINIMLALHKTEANLKTGDDDIIPNDGKFQSHKQGMLSHSLINGELTQEVMDLRWRTYKVLEHSESLVSTITGYEEDGTPIVSTVRGVGNSLENFKGDTSDGLDVILVMNNKTLGTGVNDANLTSDDNVKLDEYLTKTSSKKSIFVNREGLQQFEIEKYTRRLVVKAKEEDKVLLEFYVSKYPDTDDRRSRLFLSELKKVINGKRTSSLTDITDVYFISENTTGTDDNLEFEFKIDHYDSITEYDGHYLVKFVASKVIFGDSIFEKYKMEDLEKRYENKEKK